MKKAHTIWGQDQVAFYLDGTTSEGVDERVAHGLIHYATTPSTVYVFGYPHSEKAVSNIIGESGVTPDSPVIHNTTRQSLGQAGAFASSTNQ